MGKIKNSGKVIKKPEDLLPVFLIYGLSEFQFF